MTRSSADAGTMMREGSNIAVVSDTVDRLEMRTVPESALLRNDPTSYTGMHARRRLVPLDFDMLPPPTPWLLVSHAQEVEETERRHTLTRREYSLTAVLTLVFDRLREVDGRS